VVHQAEHVNLIASLYYCNTVRWAWLGWGLSGWLTTLLQCFDTVGLVIRPVKTVGRITYIVLVQMLNHAQSINLWKILSLKGNEQQIILLMALFPGQVQWASSHSHF